ncbi:MAG: hypothetical protein ACYC6A_24700 [Armatimonadota bacterium]
MYTEQAQEHKQVIPGPFYWALNEVADAWDAFRYLDPDGEACPLGAVEFGIYHLLCRWANNTTRECRQYLSIVCKRLDISSKTLKRHLRNMEAAKLISVERGRVDSVTGAPATTSFTLLDINEAIQYGRRLSGIAASVGEMPTPLGEMPTPLGEMPTPPGEFPTNKILREDSGKTEKKQCGARDDTPSSSPSLELPQALQGDSGRTRFPRAAALAGWCREALGVAAFPAEMPALGLEPYEQALAKLDGLLWQCGQTAVEVVTTRLSLRPEVQAQLRAAKEPAAVLGRQITYAVEDFTARALRRGDAVATGRPEPLARLPDPAPRPAEDEKPAWMSEEQWLYYETEARDGLCL